MPKYGIPVTSDLWSWAQELWWGVWFPEVLLDCRRALSRYYHGDQLRALIGSSIPEGGFEGGCEGVRVGGVREDKKEREEEVIELEQTCPCEGDLREWEDEVLIVRNYTHTHPHTHSQAHTHTISQSHTHSHTV